MEKQILVAKEAAEFLRVSIQRLYELCRYKKIPFILLGERQYRFSRQALEKWLDEGGNANNSIND